MAIVIGLAIIGGGIFAAYGLFNSKLASGTAYITTFHHDMRTQSAEYVYTKEACPELKNGVSPAQFTEVQARYKSATDDTIAFEPANSKLSGPAVYDSLTKGASGTFVSQIYRTGSVDIGIAVKQTAGSYCVLAFTVQSY